MIVVVLISVLSSFFRFLYCHQISTEHPDHRQLLNQRRQYLEPQSPFRDPHVPLPEAISPMPPSGQEKEEKEKAQLEEDIDYVFEDHFERDMKKIGKWDLFMDHGQKVWDKYENASKDEQDEIYWDFKEWAYKVLHKIPTTKEEEKHFLREQQRNQLKTIRTKTVEYGPHMGNEGYWGKEELSQLTSNTEKSFKIMPKDTMDMAFGEEESNEPPLSIEKQKMMKILVHAKNVVDKNPKAVPIAPDESENEYKDTERTYKPPPAPNPVPFIDNYGSPIIWVNSSYKNLTENGLAEVTDFITGQQRKVIVNGTIFLPIIDKDPARLGLEYSTSKRPKQAQYDRTTTSTATPTKLAPVKSTTATLATVLPWRAKLSSDFSSAAPPSPSPSSSSAPPPPSSSSSPSSPPPTPNIIKVMLRNLDVDDLDEQDWLPFEIALGGKYMKSDIDSCDANKCQARCFSMGCHTICSGASCAAGCVGPSCSAYCIGEACLSMCVGEGCKTICNGEACDARCRGKECAAECTTPNCYRTLNGKQRKGRDFMNPYGNPSYDSTENAGQDPMAPFMTQDGKMLPPRESYSRRKYIKLREKKSRRRMENFYII